MVFLWLCCEGWKLIGSYPHVSITKSAIVDDQGGVIARWDGDSWRTPGIFCNFAWTSPLLTPTDVHPHPNRGQA